MQWAVNLKMINWSICTSSTWIIFLFTLNFTNLVQIFVQFVWHHFVSVRFLFSIRSNKPISVFSFCFVCVCLKPFQLIGFTSLCAFGTKPKNYDLKPEKQQTTNQKNNPLMKKKTNFTFFVLKTLNDIPFCSKSTGGGGKRANPFLSQSFLRSLTVIRLIT